MMISFGWLMVGLLACSPDKSTDTSRTTDTSLDETDTSDSGATDSGDTGSEPSSEPTECDAETGRRLLRRLTRDEFERTGP